MTVSEYRHLKSQIIKGLVENERFQQILEELKQFYSSNINSQRSLEGIDTITKLLCILEKRDILSEENVEPLRVIASRMLNNNELLQQISEYEASQIGKERTNYYSTANNKSTNRDLIIVDHNKFKISNDRLKRIRDVIVEQIGKSWKDLGRNLSKEIQEWQLDRIDDNQRSLQAKALELMLLYESKADTRRWFVVLCDALEKSRRRDLMKLVQEIMTMSL